MIEHVWSVLCRDMVTDKETNNVSLFNVVERIGIPTDSELPAILPTVFQLVTLWSRSDMEQPTSGEAFVYINPPSGEAIEVQITDIDLTEFRRLRQRVTIVGFEIKETGVYKFDVRVKQESDKRAPAAQP